MPHSFIQSFSYSFLPPFLQPPPHPHTTPNNSTLHNPHTSQPNGTDSSPNSSSSHVNMLATKNMQTQHVIQNMQCGERKFCEASVIHRALNTLRLHKIWQSECGSGCRWWCCCDDIHTHHPTRLFGVRWRTGRSQFGSPTDSINGRKP